MEKIIYLLSLAFVCSYAGTIDQTDNSLSGRILNGQHATHQQFNYTVSIQRLSEISTHGFGHKCGGALITYQHVLTAATCTYSISFNGDILTINPSEFRVFAGSVFLSNATSDRIRLITNYFVHPEHIIAPSHVNDIAILNLTLPFALSVVTPLPLPSGNFSPSDFTRCTVAGWGAWTTGSTTPSEQLRFSNTYIYNQDECRGLVHNAQNLGNLLPTMICAAHFNVLAKTCLGDKGNPLVCGGTLTGISFLPTDCLTSTNITPVLPEVYTRVSNYTTWIRSITSSAPTVRLGLYALLLLSLFHGLFLKIVN
ncbi:trypsin alpha-like [Achroia grisella]|uniref:trypsin alpha-like n=1 Tax=Achroia grisella TaxID=688607 RepID=UPI0027D25336|nr:trypsin alpha-like [Achroia grisella]